ncbi:hypothetical protein CVT24_006150 [Panaeolus cyanescens]|uniref:Uncharacterized protein n=1 Tax=Panaeolus cyanescens TaxID=181874 RepID=A0A409VZW6_9AGAR|nr:hypothetical protein CVT24_006150 [Panaeolus cyanescens]
MDSIRKIKDKVFPDKERERKKIVRRSHSLPQMHPMYFGSTPLRAENVFVDVPMNANDPSRVIDIARKPVQKDSHHTGNGHNGKDSTRLPRTAPTDRSTVNGKQAQVKPSKPVYNKDKPLPLKPGSTRMAEKAVPVPVPKFLSPMDKSQGSLSNNSLFLNRHVQRPTDPRSLVPPPIPSYEDLTRVKIVKIETAEPDSDPFRHVAPNHASTSQTRELYLPESVPRQAQRIPESWNENGHWSGCVPRTQEPLDEPESFYERQNNLSTKSLGRNVVFKESPARRPVLVQGYWPQPSQARMESSSSSRRPEASSRSNSRRLPRVGDNSPRHPREDENMQSTGSARNVQSNVSALGKAKKLQRPALEKSGPSSNMLSTGSTKSFLSVGSNVQPRGEPSKPSPNVLKKPTKPQDKEKASSNALSTGSSTGSLFGMRSKLIPENERKPRPDIKSPSPLRPFKRQA